MPDVWYVMPVALPHKAEPCIQRWKDRGYKVAIAIDAGHLTAANADWWIRVEPYLGYPHAVNLLCKRLLAMHPGIDWICAGGDDMEPDNCTPGYIAASCTEHFGGTFGVCQPTGDPFMPDRYGVPAAARICGSPWMGRKFIQCINGGLGPFWPGYFHFYADEEMQNVTERLGILWQRPDLCQMHNHWSKLGHERPAYLDKANNRWEQDKQIFEQRQAAGFPGSAPIEQAVMA